MCPEQPETIFVSEFTKEDGSRDLISFWVFTKSYVLEGKNFAGTGETLDVTYIRKAITWLESDRKNYDLKEAVDASRLMIVLNLAHPAARGALNAIPRASKHNCDVLRDVYLKYLKPNIIG